MVSYKHTPLHGKSIRILNLLRGSGKDEIRCRIAPRKEEEYEAVSWCWGNKRETATIQILGDDPAQDATILIKPNLESALRHLRLPEQNRYLWIDAICIDQSDKHERNVQVAMMSDIYECADKVCVWLGDEEHDSQMAIDFIKNDIADLDQFDQLVDGAGGTDKWKALTALLTREWFERRWVVQEIALGKNAELYCGQGSVMWTDFTIAVALFESRSKALSKLYKASPSHDYNPNFLGDVEALGATRLVHVISNLLRRSDTGHISERCLNLEQLVANLATFQAREPHDLIYAVLALAKDTYRRTRAKEVNNAASEPAQKSDGTRGTPRTRQTPSRSAGAQKRKAPFVAETQEIGNISTCSTPQKKARTISSTGSPSSSQKHLSRPEETASISNTAPEQLSQKQIYNTSSNTADLMSDKISDRKIHLVQNAINKFQKGVQTDEYRVFNVDYEQPFFNVCKQFLEFTLPKTRDLDILCRPWAPEAKGDGERLILPSWVPSLSGAAFGKKRSGDAAGGFKMVRKNADPLVGPSGFGTRYYNASNLQAHPDSWKFGTVNTEMEHSFYVTGFVLDWIDVLGPASQMGNLPKQWMALAGWEHDTDPSEDLWRTLVADRGPNGQNCPEYYPRACAHARRRSTIGEGIETGEFIKHGRCSILTEFMERVRCVVWNRRLIKSKGLKALGLVPDTAEKGDLIFVIHGCSVPVVLRKVDQDPSGGQGHHYEFLGECYLHGMMDGQATSLQREIISYIELRRHQLAVFLALIKCAPFDPQLGANGRRKPML